MPNYNPWISENLVADGFIMNFLERQTINIIMKSWKHSVAI